DVAAELVEERRLDAILVRLRVGLRRARAREPCRDPDGKSAGAQQARRPRPIGPGEFPSRSSAQCVHLSFTYPPRAISLPVAGFPNSTWPESRRFCPTTESSSRSEEHTSELQSRGHLVCRLLLEKKKQHE